MMLMIWRRDKEIRGVLIEEPEHSDDVYRIKVYIMTIGRPHRVQQTPAKDEASARTIAREKMQLLKDDGYTFAGEGAILKKERDIQITTPANKMDDPLAPTLAEAMEMIEGGLSKFKL